jgi:protein TonB
MDKTDFMNYRLFLHAFVLAAGCGLATGCYKADVRSVSPAEVPLEGEVISDSTVICKVPVESQYKGGSAAWLQFLAANCKFPEDAVQVDVQGIVTVAFVVGKDGAVSQVQAISGPELLRGEAERVIRLSDRWEPALDNGLPVASIRKQPIVFKLVD